MNSQYIRDRDLTNELLKVLDDVAKEYPYNYEGTEFNDDRKKLIKNYCYNLEEIIIVNNNKSS